MQYLKILRLIDCTNQIRLGLGIGLVSLAIDCKWLKWCRMLWHESVAGLERMCFLILYSVLYVYVPGMHADELNGLMGFVNGVGDLLWAGATWGRWMEPLHQLHMPRPLTIYWLNLSWSFHGIQSGKKPRLERACACWTGFGSHKAVNIPKSWGHDVMNCDERWVPLQIRAWGFSPARNRWRGVGCMGLWFTDALIGWGESRSLQIQGCASLSHHPSLSCQRGLDLECIFLSLLSGVSVFP